MHLHTISALHVLAESSSFELGTCYHHCCLQPSRYKRVSAHSATAEPFDSEWAEPCDSEWTEPTELCESRRLSGGRVQPPHGAW